jgi:hypothetical protein
MGKKRKFFTQCEKKEDRKSFHWNFPFSGKVDCFGIIHTLVNSFG